MRVERSYHDTGISSKQLEFSNGLISTLRRKSKQRQVWIVTEVISNLIFRGERSYHDTGISSKQLEFSNGLISILRRKSKQRQVWIVTELISWGWVWGWGWGVRVSQAWQDPDFVLSEGTHQLASLCVLIRMISLMKSWIQYLIYIDYWKEFKKNSKRIIDRYRYIGRE